MIQTRATEWLLFAVAVVLLAWEVAVLRFGEPGSTISEVLYTLARKYPEVPLFAGLILGHCFWWIRNP